MQHVSERPILCVCGDAGGAAAVAPVVGHLAERETYSVKIFVYGPGEAVFARLGYDYEILDESYSELEIEKIWCANNPSALLCGTSVNALEYEKAFTLLANRDHVPSLAVLDFWSGYGRRFDFDDKPMLALPDRVAVMDQLASDRMEAAGCPASHIVITGQPAFDQLAEIREGFSKESRLQLREALGLSRGELLIAFLSQPIRTLMQQEDGRFPEVGYDEWHVLDLLDTALNEICLDNNLSAALVVKPHPRDRSPAPLRTSDRVRGIQVEEVDVHSLMLSADLVVGMTTVALVESCYLGCLTVSLQPDSLREDRLPTNASGVSMGVYHSRDITGAVSRMLLDEGLRSRYRTRLAAFACDGQAGLRVSEALVNLIEGKA